MADSVTRTIASRGFTILGSGTSSTLTLCFPCQQIAFMRPPFPPGGESSDRQLLLCRAPRIVLPWWEFHLSRSVAWTGADLREAAVAVSGHRELRELQCLRGLMPD